MKIAVPKFGSRVSPRFDCAQLFLIVTTDGTIGVQRDELLAAGWSPHEHISRLVELGVDTVICGGIDTWSAASLRSAGINVYQSVTGDVDEAVDALRRGDLCGGGLAPSHAAGRSAATEGDLTTAGRLDGSRPGQ